jgi:aldehyde:ferredoxin oxidoreductase
LDTISTGCTIAFAIECYENGIITKEDTDGIELGWGNHQAIVAMTEKLAKRKGLGDVLADGVKVAADRIGKGSEQYAIHVGGQEVPMHDPKFRAFYALSYRMDATPARHTQGVYGMPLKGMPIPAFDLESFSGRAEAYKKFMMIGHIVNCIGMCQFMYATLYYDPIDADAIQKFINTTTGWNTTMNELLTTAERIANLRQAFNFREGLNPLRFEMPNRTVGRPPQEEGPLAGVTIDDETMVKEYLAAMDWDPETAKPSKKKLIELGLEDVARELWP